MRLQRGIFQFGESPCKWPLCCDRARTHRTGLEGRILKFNKPQVSFSSDRNTDRRSSGVVDMSALASRANGKELPVVVKRLHSSDFFLMVRLCLRVMQSLSASCTQARVALHARRSLDIHALLVLDNSRTVKVAVLAPQKRHSSDCRLLWRTLC